MIRRLRIATCALFWWATQVFLSRTLGWGDNAATLYVVCVIGGYATVALTDSRKERR